MAELAITHTATEGTTLTGSARGDGTYEVMQTQVRTKAGAGGWAWARSLGCWIIRGSRDKQPNRLAISTAVQALEAAGHTVTVDLSYEHRPAEVAAAARADRQEGRVAALTAKVDRAQQRREAAEATASKRWQSVPPMGEPIKVGHHSERRHRRSIERAAAAETKAVQARKDVHCAEQRLEAASNGLAPDSAGTIARRIERLEAEQRADIRARDGYTRTIGVNGQTGQPITETGAPATGERRTALEAQISQRADEIAFQRKQLEQLRAAGVRIFDRSMVRKGDYVRVGQRWWPHSVRRVNAKTVTVGTDYSWTETVPYSSITDIRDADGRVVEFGEDGRRIER